MPNLQDILSMLMGQAQPRPDIGMQQPVATFAGRVVNPGENVQSALQRMPMGSGEGDISAKLQALTGALAQPGMQAGGSLLAKALLPKLAMMMPGGPFYHGTPNVFQEFDPSMTKSSGLVGPGHAYLTSSPEVAGSYAAGATHGLGSTPTVERAMAAGKQPNIRPYMVKPHESFVTEAPFSQKDMDMLLGAIRQGLGESTPGSFQKGGQASRAANVVKSVQPQVGQPGQVVYDILTNMLGPDRTNQILKQAGFQAIEYPGGSIMGDIQHRAINVLDPSIMRNLFEALATPPTTPTK